MTITLDPRLPDLAEITEPTRQQVRRCTRKHTPCAKCHEPLTADTLCLVNGNRDCHRWCAEWWNYQLFEVWDELRAQDAAEAEAAETDAAGERALAMGLAVPTGGGLWTPPSAHQPNETPVAAGATA